MIFTLDLRRAIRFSIQVHERDQKQKRKNKDVAYITHPLTVGLTLAGAGADEKVVIAGILHDVIEDSVPEKKVTKEMVVELFGNEVADLVADVSEEEGQSWEARKNDALARIGSYSHNALLVKSADLISNGTELMDDYREFGDGIFANFERPKQVREYHFLQMVRAVVARWPESPLAEDLKNTEQEMIVLFKIQE